MEFRGFPVRPARPFPSPIHHHGYVVTGRAPFPKEAMLLDRSEPATEEDRQKIERLTSSTDDGLAHVSLVIRDAGRLLRPHIPEWRRHGWNVPSETEQLAEESRHGWNSATGNQPSTERGSSREAFRERMAFAFTRP